MLLWLRPSLRCGPCLNGDSGLEENDKELQRQMKSNGPCGCSGGALMPFNLLAILASGVDISWIAMKSLLPSSHVENCISGGLCLQRTEFS